jgi:hypothetical protein
VSKKMLINRKHSGQGPAEPRCPGRNYEFRFRFGLENIPEHLGLGATEGLSVLWPCTSRISAGAFNPYEAAGTKVESPFALAIVSQSSGLFSRMAKWLFCVAGEHSIFGRANDELHTYSAHPPVRFRVRDANSLLVNWLHHCWSAQRRDHYNGQECEFFFTPALLPRQRVAA